MSPTNDIRRSHATEVPSGNIPDHGPAGHVDSLRRPDDPDPAQRRRAAGGCPLHPPLRRQEAALHLGIDPTRHRKVLPGQGAQRPHQPSGCCQHVDPHGKRRPGSWLRSAPGWTTACCSLTSTTAASVAVSKRPYPPPRRTRSEEHTSELQSLMRISYAVFCLKKKNKTQS